MNTFAPSDANIWAAARPIPLLPPVITATFPSSLLISSGSSSCWLKWKSQRVGGLAPGTHITLKPTHSRSQACPLDPSLCLRLTALISLHCYVNTLHVDGYSQQPCHTS